MSDVFQRKNYYFQQTMLNEIENYKIISFNLFDTLLLRDTLFDRDVWRIVEERAEARYGITDFCGIRENLENELRGRSDTNTITLEEIYRELEHRYPAWPIGELQILELDTEREFTRVNPLIARIYQAAQKAGKTIYILADTCLPKSYVQKLLKHLNCEGYDGLYLSGDCKKSKEMGDLYRLLLDEVQCDPWQWLHIGNDLRRDMECPRQLHITAAAYRSPRDDFFENRIKEHEEAEKEAGCSLVQEPLDPSLQYSKVTACRINEIYTDIQEPSKETVISVDDVSMMFNMCSEKVDSIKEYVIRLLKRQLKFKEFWALQNVSFTVKRGEKVGLVGLNGSGKSTMLKVVSGVMKATKGRVTVQGSIAPLIELGAGFDMELSAKENVFLNGAILGYNREDMQKRYDEIIEFAELRDFENVAIKNFSSGMIARLGFAIATCHVPDILIIDEILSVGDFTFQQKCHKKMQELTQQGATVLFVSHSAVDIINMCDRAVWLDHGHLVQEGQAQYVVDQYLNQ